MMKWLATLTYHNYEITPAGGEHEISPFLEAQRLLDSKPETLLVQTDKDSIAEDVSCLRSQLFHTVLLT